MKLQSPKKKRRLYTPKRDVVVDFVDDEEPNSGIKENVENILNRLQNDKDLSSLQINQLASPCKVQVSPYLKKIVFLEPKLIIKNFFLQIEKITDAQLFNILENPATKISFVEATPTKTITEISSSSPNNKILTNLKTLDLNMDCTDTYQQIGDEQENSSPRDQNKLFSLFYKDNWNKMNNVISE